MTILEAFTTFGLLALATLAPHPDPRVGDAGPDCGAILRGIGTAQVNVGDRQTECSGSCDGALFIVAIAILSDADACEGGPCSDSGVVIGGAIGGSNNLCREPEFALALLT